MNAPWELPIESQRLGFPGIHSPVILGPNISGKMNNFYGELWADDAVDGCFTKFENGQVKSNQQQWYSAPVLVFDASLSNAKYSRESFQPESSYALIIIKV